MGPGPQRIAVNPLTSRAYVTNSGYPGPTTNTVSVIDLATNTVTATVVVGMYPHAVDIHPALNRIYVANVNSDSISIIDGTTNLVSTTLLLAPGTKPFGLAVNPAANRVYIAEFGANAVQVLDATHAIAWTGPVGSSPHYVAVNPVLGRAYVPNAGSNTLTVLAFP